jgi:hypothetical protein
MIVMIIIVIMTIYYTLLGVEHHILWKIGGKLSNVEVEEAITQLKFLKNNVELRMYFNPPHLKSIPDIDHCHILTKLI